MAVDIASLPLSKTPTLMTSSSFTTDQTPLPNRQLHRHSYQQFTNCSQHQAYAQNLFLRQQQQQQQPQQGMALSASPPLDTKENQSIGSSSNATAANHQQQQQQPTHSRSKSSVLRSLLHRRNPSDGAALVPALNLGLDDAHGGVGSAPVRVISPAPPASAGPGSSGGYLGASPLASPRIMFTSAFGQPAAPMTPGRGTTFGELQPNRPESPLTRSPPMSREERRTRTVDDEPCQRSPNKFTLAGLGIMGMSPSKDKSTSSPSKFKKPKSVSNLSALLSRPKSHKDLAKQAAQDEAHTASKGKENMSPSNDDMANAMHPDYFAPPQPTFAQYSSNDGALSTSPRQMGLLDQNLSDARSDKSGNSLELPAPPHCRHVPGTRSANPSMTNLRAKADAGGAPPKASLSRTQRGTKVLSAIAALSGGGHGRSKSSTASSTANRMSSSGSSNDLSEMPQIDPKDVDRHLEAMLDRRNIPENQRYKMRNLSFPIKVELIRQDWAEMSADRHSKRPRTNDSVSSAEGGVQTGLVMDAKESSSRDGKDTADGQDGQDGKAAKRDDSSKDTTGKEKSKRNRGSFTLGRSGKKEASGATTSTKKSKGGTSIGRHFRSKSTESLSDRPLTGIETVTKQSGGMLSKNKLQQCPADFVACLRKVQKPELVEVGKLHKLRLLLRNETVSWTDEFIAHGGMKEIVGLLKRIMEVEWR